MRKGGASGECIWRREKEAARDAGRGKGRRAQLPRRPLTRQVDALPQQVAPDQHVERPSTQPVDDLEPLCLLHLAVKEGALDAAGREESGELLGGAARKHRHECALGPAAALLYGREQVVFIPPQLRRIDNLHLIKRSRDKWG